MSMARGIRAATARSPTRTANALTVSSLVAAGYPAAGAESSETTARKLSAVDRCIEILSDSVAKLPNFIMDADRNRPRHPLLRVLNTRPNEAMTPFIRKKVLETSRLEGGSGYDWIVRNPRTGAVEELIPLPWWLVHPWRDTNGRIWYTVTHPVTGSPFTLPNADICHYKNTTRNGITCQSTLARGSEIIATAAASQAYERAYYENGGQPSGVLQTDADLAGYAKDADGKTLTREDGSFVTRKDLLRGEWERIHGGPTNSHRLAILDLGLKYSTIASSNRDAQFVENKQLSVTDIARLFGVPLYKLNEGKQAYGSNEQNAIEYVVSTLHPIVTQYEEEQTYKLLTDTEIDSGLEIRINLMAELKGDTSSRGSWYSNMRNNGAFSANDIRRLEDLPDVDGGDEYQASLNYVPLSSWKRLSEKRSNP